MKRDLKMGKENKRKGGKGDGPGGEDAGVGEGVEDEADVEHHLEGQLRLHELQTKGKVDGICNSSEHSA